MQTGSATDKELEAELHAMAKESGHTLHDEDDLEAELAALGDEEDLEVCPILLDRHLLTFDVADEVISSIFLCIFMLNQPFRSIDDKIEIVTHLLTEFKVMRRIFTISRSEQSIQNKVAELAATDPAQSAIIKKQAEVQLTALLFDLIA